MQNAPKGAFCNTFDFHSATINFVIKIFVFSIFECPFYTGFTVLSINRSAKSQTQMIAQMWYKSVQY